jgi:hypothetical protein
MELLHIVVLGIVLAPALTALVLGWQSWRSGRAFRCLMPRFYRNRESQEQLWRQYFGDEAMPRVDRVLTIICDSFAFNPDHRYHLSPSDLIMDIYRGCHLPRWLQWLDCDAREIEDLLNYLHRDFGFEQSQWHYGLTIGHIAEFVERAQTSVTDNSPL